MTITTTGMNTALRSLQEAIDALREQTGALDGWRWGVRQRLTAVRDALVAEADDPDEGWLVAREGTALRERNLLLSRIRTLEPQVLESPAVERVRAALNRLVVDVTHHVQRLHDLAYDQVELELGGSE